MATSFAGNFKTPTAQGQDQDVVFCHFDASGGDFDACSGPGQDLGLFFTGHTNGITGDVNTLHIAENFPELPFPAPPAP